MDMIGAGPVIGREVEEQPITSLAIGGRKEKATRLQQMKQNGFNLPSTGEMLSQINQTPDPNALQGDALSAYNDMASLVTLSPDQAKIISTAIGSSDDPFAEMGKYFGAVALSERSGFDIQTAYNNLDIFSDYYLGKPYQADYTGLKGLLESWQVGVDRVDIMALQRQYMLKDLAGEDVSDLENQIQTLLEANEEKISLMPTRLYNQALQWSAQQLPYISTTMMQGATAGMVTVAGATGLGLVAGANPLAGGISAAALFTAGSTAGSFKYISDTSAATSYWRQTHDLGVSKNIAMVTSSLAGWATGGIELAIGGLIKTGLGVITRGHAEGMISKAIMSLNGKGKIGTIAVNAARLVDQANGEGLTELFETYTDALADEIALYADGKISTSQARDVIKESFSAYGQAFVSSLLLGIPSTVQSAKYDVQVAQHLRETANNIPSKESFIKESEQYRPEDVTETDHSQAMANLWESAHEDTKGTVVHSEEIAKVELDAGNRTTETDGSIQRLQNGELYRTDTDKGYLRGDSTTESHELLFGSPATGARYGALNYAISKVKNQIIIDDIRVDLGYESIRPEMIRNLSNMYPGYAIDWDPQTEQLQAIRDDLIANNPLGKEKGLTYYDGVTADVDDRRMVQQAIRKNMPKLTEEESFVASELLMLRAESKGMTGQQYVNTYFSSDGIFGKKGDVPINDNRGAVAFGDDARALIYTSQYSDFSTWVHEAFHVAAREMEQKGELSKAIREASTSEDFKTYLTDHASPWGLAFDADKIVSDLQNLDDVNWTRSQEENIARIYESWLSDGKVSSPKLTDIFRRIAKFMAKVYKSLKHTVQLDERVAKGFESLYEKNPDFARMATSTAREDILFQADDTAMSQVGREHSDTESLLRENPDNFDADGNHLAPNGKPSNLTYEQWVQVRTPAFKKWFGDWENNAKILRCLESEAIKVHEIPVDWSKDRMTVQRAVKDWAKNNIRGDYYNSDTATTISVTGKSIAEVLHHDTGVTYDDTQLKSVAYIPEIIQKAVHLDTRTNESQKGTIKKYDYFLSVIQIDGTDFLVRSVVAENQQGQKYYDHKLTKKEDFQKRYWITSPGFSSESSLSDLNDKRLLQILQDNSSKVVDANGEPMVVYHGTTNRDEVSTWNPKWKGYDTEYSMFSVFRRKNEGRANSGFFFNSDMDNAGGYGSEMYSCYLNLRNPLIIEANGQNYSSVKFGAMEKDTYDWARYAEKEGYDGVIFNNISDGVGFGDLSVPTNDYVAFKSNQIKSATDNRGTFDGGNPNILFQTNKADAEYFKALDENDMEKAQRIIDNQARLKGYISDDDYRMMHGAPRSGNDLDVNIVQLQDGTLVPKDYWTHPESYGIQYEPGGWESFHNINRALGLLQRWKDSGIRKTPYVQFYRAVPIDVKEDSFRNGDWITPSKAYALEHGQDHINGPFRIISQKVRADNAYWNGDSINEWGYDDGNNYAYKNTKNNRKLLDVITRDYDGNIIPPSKRFNYRNWDILFQEAYHGSPYQFDEFSLDRVGDGEGLQAFGYGLYFSNKRTIAEGYAKTLSSPHYTAIGLVAQDLKYIMEVGGKSFEDARKFELKAKKATLEMFLEDPAGKKDIIGLTKQKIKWLERATESEFARLLTERTRNLYVVDIADGDYLLWDEDITKVQRDKITNQLFTEEFSKNELITIANQHTGKEVYQHLSETLGSDYEASMLLARAGIAGIDYPANSLSGKVKDGVRNYVVFDDRNVKITDHILFQTANDIADEVLHEAQGFDSWEEFRNYYEGFVFEGDELPADTWFIDVWEQANKITETMPEPARILEGSETDKDTQFISLLADDVELDTFIETVGDILNDDTFKQGRFADQAEYDQALTKENLKGRFKTEASRNIKALANKVYKDKYELTAEDRESIRGTISKDRQTRYYRDLYAAVMDRDDMSARIIDENLPQIDSPEYAEYARLNIADRVQMIEDIADAKLRDAVLSGKGSLEQNADRVLKKMAQEKKTLEKRISDLEAKLSDKDRRIVEETTNSRQLFEKNAEVRDKLNHLNKLINRKLEEGARVSDRQLAMRGSLQHEADTLQNQIAKLTNYRNKYLNEKDRIAKRDSRINALQQQKEELKAEIESTRKDLNADNRKNVNLLLTRLADMRKQMEQLTREAAIDEQEAIARAKAELKQRWRQETMARHLKEHAAELNRQIFRRPAMDIDSAYRAKIYAIQSTIDPNFMTYQNRVSGKFITYNEYAELIKQVGEDGVRQELGDRLYELIKKRVAKTVEDGHNPLESWDVVALENVANEVQRLRQEGKAVLETKRTRERLLADRDRLQIINDLVSVGFNPPAYPGTVEAEKAKRGWKERYKGIKYATWTMSRKAQLLDGGKKGKSYELLVTDKRKHQDTYNRNIDNRLTPIYQALEALGKDINELYTQIPVKLQWEFDGTYTLSDLMYIYLSQKNDRNKNAVAYGNLVHDAEKERMFYDNERIAELGLARYNQLVGIAKDRIESAGLMPVVQAIEKDFGSQSERIQKVAIDVYNQPMEMVDYYLPIDRQSLNGRDIDEQSKSDMFNESTGKFLSSVDTGFGKQRIDIAPSHQLPVDLDLFRVWHRSVKEQEYFIEHAAYVKHIKRVFQGRDSREISTYIRGTYGDALLDDLSEYIDEIIRPDEFKKATDTDRLIKTMRGNLGSAYLSWKMSGIILQAITSPAPFLSEISVGELFRSYMTLATNWKDSWDFIISKSQMMKNRSMNTIIDDLHKAMASGTQNKAQRALNQFNDIGIRGLEITDRVSVSGGWLAAYNNEYARLVNEQGLSDAEADIKAITYADELVLRTQPTGDRTEIAPLFKSGGEAVKAFTQFQVALNVIWNNLSYDLPQFIKNREYSKAVGTVGGYVLAGVLLGAVANGFDGDDETSDKIRKGIYWSLTQFTGAVPLLGNYVDDLSNRLITGEKGYTSTTMYPAVDKAFKSVSKTIAGNIPGAIADLAEGFGLFFGLPTSGTKEAIRIFTDTPLAPLGRRNDI